MSLHADHTDRDIRWRRGRAVLAGGLVLGVGAAITLAAWTDTENATGEFGASIFSTESRSAGSPTYASNSVAPGAILPFAATAMSPGVPHYAWLTVRTTPATTVAGTVELTGMLADGALTAGLEFRAVRLSSPGAACDAAAFTGGGSFIVGGPALWTPVTGALPAPVVSPIGAAGAELGFCFEVRIVTSAGTGGLQGTAGSITWTFTATSDA